MRGGREVGEGGGHTVACTRRGCLTTYAMRKLGISTQCALVPTNRRQQNQTPTKLTQRAIVLHGAHSSAAPRDQEHVDHLPKTSRQQKQLCPIPLPLCVWLSWCWGFLGAGDPSLGDLVAAPQCPLKWKHRSEDANNHSPFLCRTHPLKMEHNSWLSLAPEKCVRRIGRHRDPSRLRAIFPLPLPFFDLSYLKL